MFVLKSKLTQMQKLKQNTINIALLKNIQLFREKDLLSIKCGNLESENKALIDNITILTAKNMALSAEIKAYKKFNKPVFDKKAKAWRNSKTGAFVKAPDPIKDELK